MFAVICLNVICGNDPVLLLSNLFRNNIVCRYTRYTETVIIAQPAVLVRLQIYKLIGTTRFASH